MVKFFSTLAIYAICCGLGSSMCNNFTGGWFSAIIAELIVYSIFKEKQVKN